MLNGVLQHLAALVSADSRNPPRAITAGHALFRTVAAALPSGFVTQRWDLGGGCAMLLAIRGAPKVVFNFHLDTVPDAPGWTVPPLQVTPAGDRVLGLGVADTKGAAACMLEAVRHAHGDVALLFSSDEEAGTSLCIRTFLKEHAAGLEFAVVAEPTGGKAVLAHRGLVTWEGTFAGTPGHASSPAALQDSAVHEMIRWGARALHHAEVLEAQEHAGLRGVRLNVGRAEGGQKPNMVAGTATVRVGIRPLPQQDALALMRTFQNLAQRPARVTWKTGFVAPPLPQQAQLGAAALQWAHSNSLPMGNAVDFWTEAALFSQAGLPALVLGAGDIAQAHTADEWVALEQLEGLTATYVRLLNQETA